MAFLKVTLEFLKYDFLLKKMKYILNRLERIKFYFITLIDRYSHDILRFNIGFIYFIFGVLKFSPNSSPAEQLAISTMEKISFGIISGSSSLLLLAVVETVVGLCILFNYKLRLAIYLALGHMIGTFLPLYLFPEQAFSDFPVSISLMGQYIIKNLVIVSALLVLFSKIPGKQSNVILMRVIKEDIPHNNGDRNDEINQGSETVQRKLAALSK